MTSPYKRWGEFMRIGMFTDSYFPQVSGVSTSIRVLKEELEAKGHEVIIFTTTDPKAEAGEKGIVRLTSIPFFSFKDRRVAIKGFSKALREAKRYNLDIIHTHTEFSLGLAGRFVAYMLDIPTVHTYHTLYEKYLHYIAKGKVVKPGTVAVASRVFCNRTMGIIAPSQMMKEKLESYHIYKEIRVIPTGVEIPDPIPNVRETMRRQLGIAEAEIVLLSLSRVAYEKKLERILYAFPEVLEKHPTAKLVVVGDGPAREDLEMLAEELGVGASVLFVGEVKNEDVAAYYQMADLYVNASESETQGLTFLESIVNGCPVVALRNDYLSGLIRKPGLGELFEDEGQMGSCINGMIERLQSSEQVQGEEWQYLLEEISSGTFGRKVLSFYRRVIEDYYFQEQKDELRVRLLNRLKRVN